MPSQLRCGLGLGVTVLSVTLILITLSPGVDVVLCDCAPSSPVHENDNVRLLCAPFGASLSNIAKEGDNGILFVYWILVMAVALLCLRIAGLITFFHSEEAEQCFAIDIVVNVVFGVLTTAAMVLIISWANRSDRCSLIDIADNWLSTIPLLMISAGSSGIVAIIDVVTALIPANMMYFYSPVLSMTQDSHVHIDLGMQGRGRGRRRGGGDSNDGNAQVDAAIDVNGVSSSSSGNEIKPVYTIDDDEIDVEHNGL